MPSLKSDISVRAFRHDGKERYRYESSALAAATFLLLVRGLPLDEISVETPMGDFYVNFTENGGKCGIILRKCKILCTNKAILLGGVELLCTETLTINGTVRVFFCEDSGCFSKESLSALSLADEKNNIVGALAVSVKNGYASVKAHSVNSERESIGCDMLLAAASALERSNQLCFLTAFYFFGTEYRISSVCGDFLVSGYVKPMIFEAASL